MHLLALLGAPLYFYGYNGWMGALDTAKGPAVVGSSCTHAQPRPADTSFSFHLPDGRSLGPHEAAAVRADALLDELARHEAGPEIAEEVGLLLDVAVAEERGDGPGGFFGVVEGDAAAGQGLAWV